MIATRPLSPGVGLEVLGVDMAATADPAVRRRLWELFIDSGVLLFRGAGTSAEAHLAFSRCFGELERHSVRESWTEGCPELIDLTYLPPPPGERPKTQPVYELDGEPVAGWLPWHTDQCFVPRLSRGGMLRALEVPPYKGRTGFIDKIRLYDMLDDGMKARIEGLSVIYQFQPDVSRHRFGRPAGLRLLSSSAAMDGLVQRLDQDFPPAVHPLVYPQAETGRRVLNFSPAYAIGVQGMATRESDALLDALTRHCLTPGQAYYHAWQVDDLVVWDNWRTLHCAEGAPAEHARRMHRTSIAGDYGLGSAAAAPV